MIHRSRTRTIDRLAGRIVRQHRAVSLGAIGIVAVSVGVASVLVTRATTPLVDSTKATAALWGTADAVVFADAGSSHNFGGQPPPQPGSCCTTAVHTVDQLRAESNFPTGTPSLAIESFQVVMARLGMADRGVAMPVVQADLSGPLAVGMSRVVAGRLPTTPGEVAVLRPPDATVPTGIGGDSSTPTTNPFAEAPTTAAPTVGEVFDGRLGSTINALAPARQLSVVGELVAPVADVVSGGPVQLLVAPGTFPPSTDPAWNGWQQGRSSWNGVVLASLERPSSWTLTSRWGARREDSSVGTSLPQPVGDRNPNGASALMAAIAVLWALAVAGAVASALLGQHGRDLAQVHMAGGTGYVISRLGARVMRPFVLSGTLIGSAVGFVVGLATVHRVDPMLEPAQQWVTPLLAAVGLAVGVVVVAGMVLGGVVARAGAPTAADLMSRPGVDHVDRIPRRRGWWILIGSGAVAAVLVFVLASGGSMRGIGHVASLAVPVTIVVTAAIAIAAARFLLVVTTRRSGASVRWPAWRLAARDLTESMRSVTVGWVAVSLAILLALFSVTAWESDQDRDQRLQNDAAARSTAGAVSAADPSADSIWSVRQPVVPGNDLTVRDGSVQTYAPIDLEQRAFDAGFDSVRLAMDPHLCMSNLAEVTGLGLTGACAPASSITVIADEALDRVPAGLAEPLRSGQPVAWYAGTIRAIPESLSWQPGGVGPTMAISLDAGDGVAALNAASAAAAANPLVGVLANPTVLISQSTAVGLGLDRASVSAFAVDPSRTDRAQVDQMAAVVSAGAGGVEIVDGSTSLARTQLETVTPPPTPNPSGWLLGGLGALVVGSALVGLLLDRWQRRSELAVLEMQGATRRMFAGSAAIQAWFGTATILAPMAFGLWFAAQLVEISPGMLGSFTMYVAWHPVIWLALAVPFVAAGLAWSVVIVGRAGGGSGVPPVPIEAADREMISA